MISQKTRQRILELFEAALEKEPAERPEFLARACGTDDRLWEEVSSLVAEYERRGETHDPRAPAGEAGAAAAPLQRIGRYEVGRELGRGGMGIVFEAYDPVLERNIALKTIRLDSYGTPAGKEWLRARLLREARTAASLAHANIVGIHDSGMQEELAYIAMEKVDGPTLERRMAAGDVSVEEALGILQQAAAALDYAHASGVVHRDIKPGNIMLQHGTTVKITDFGIAKITTGKLTRTTMTAGTPSYMSPEQIRNQAVDGRSDQFSLAVVAYELLTGDKPFRGESEFDLMKQIVDGERASLLSGQTGLAPGVDQVLARALAKEGAERYASCREFADALEAALRQSELAPAAGAEVHPARDAAPARANPGSEGGDSEPAAASKGATGRGVAAGRRIRRYWPAAAALIALAAVATLVHFWPPATERVHRLEGQRATGTSEPPLDPRHVALHEDFEKLGLRVEALLDGRPSNPHAGTQTKQWRTMASQVRGLTDVASVAAGWTHSIVRRKDGSLWAWGQNLAGRLGDGTETDRAAPVRVLLPERVRFKSYGTGGADSWATSEDGRVWAWGDNSSGQLADGTTRARPTPAPIEGLTGTAAIDLSGQVLALKKDGTVWSWGLNEDGQLGDGTRTDRRKPAQVQGLADIVAIAAGNTHSLALSRDGTVWVWGLNQNGRLGDGTTVTRLRPVRVRDLSGVKAIAAANHSVALKNDGTVWNWGPNAYGELGDGTLTDRSAPVQARGLTEVTAIVAGSQHTLALRRDGTVWAWGQNYYGALGDGTSKDHRIPMPVRGLHDVVQIGPGRSQHGLALKRDGTVWTWGWNDDGQLGPPALRELESTGAQDVTVNYNRISGPHFAMVGSDFPYVQFDRDGRRIIMQPGNFEVSQWAAVVGWDVPADGEYAIGGAFQRAYTDPRVGDGVDAAIVPDLDEAHPLWAEHIAPGQMERRPFALRVALRRGQVVRFVVYSGPQGKDGTFDETALEATIDRQ